MSDMHCVRRSIANCNELMSGGSTTNLPFKSLPVADKLAAARQLQGSGRGNLAAYNPKSWTDLTEYMDENPIRDGDAWLAGLMKRNQLLGTCRLDMLLDAFQCC